MRGKEEERGGKKKNQTKQAKGLNAIEELLVGMEKYKFLFSFLRVERSTDQVIKPVNVEALSKWVGKIPADVLQDMPVIAPMLAKLGYDPYANPPNYGKPDQKVVENTRRVRLLCV